MKCPQIPFKKRQNKQNAEFCRCVVWLEPAPPGNTRVPAEGSSHPSAPFAFGCGSIAHAHITFGFSLGPFAHFYCSVCTIQHFV